MFLEVMRFQWNVFCFDEGTAIKRRIEVGEKSRKIYLPRQAKAWSEAAEKRG